MDKFVITVTVNGAGAGLPGGLGTGTWTFLAEANTGLEAVNKIGLGKDCRKVTVVPVDFDKTER